MRPLLVALASACVLLVAVPAAGGTMIRTNWKERVEFANGQAITIYVRKIEVTKSSWRAWVRIANTANRRVDVRAGFVRPRANAPAVYYSPPGIWWQTRGSAGGSLTQIARGKATPRYPKALASGKTWFGILSGSTANVPDDRPLRIGFGTFVLEGNDKTVGTQLVEQPVIVATTHEFRLPPDR